MGSYEIVATVVFLIACAIFVFYGVKSFTQAVKETDNKGREKFRRKALSLVALALMFLLCALYVIFRISWFMMIVFLIGSVAVAYTIGFGFAANMREH